MQLEIIKMIVNTFILSIYTLYFVGKNRGKLDDDFVHNKQMSHSVYLYQVIDRGP